MTMPAGAQPVKDFTVEAGAPTVVTVTYKGQKYKCRLQMSVLGVMVLHGDVGGLPNFIVQSGNVMSIEKDGGS